MTTLLLNENKPTPVTEALEGFDIRLVRNNWQPDEATLKETQACLVSFYDCLSRPVDIWRLRRRLVPYRIPMIAWNRDAPAYLNKQQWRLNVLDRFRLLDIYLTHALPDDRRFAPAAYLFHNAARTETYNLGGASLEALRDPQAYRYDVSFVGAISPRRIREYRGRQDFFDRLKPELDRRGITHCIVDTEERVLSYTEQVALFQQSRINLNYGAGCEYGFERAWGLPERCFGLPACGAFLLCDRRVHAADAFHPASEWADFGSLEEALVKIDYYLKHFDQARAVAEAAYKRVLANHTYRHRASEFLDIVKDWWR